MHFVNKNVWSPIKISVKSVPKFPIKNIPALVPIKAWLPPGDTPLSEGMMVTLPTHQCATRPQWNNSWRPIDPYMHHESRPKHYIWDDGLSRVQCLAITSANSDVLLIVPIYQHQGKLHQNTTIFIQKNAFPNVTYKMASVLSRPQCAY